MALHLSLRALTVAAPEYALRDQRLALRAPWSLGSGRSSPAQAYFSPPPEQVGAVRWTMPGAVQGTPDDGVWSGARHPAQCWRSWTPHVHG